MKKTLFLLLLIPCFARAQLVSIIISNDSVWASNPSTGVGILINKNANNSITAAMLAGSIPYSKLILTGSVLNADLAGSIAYSKLSLTGAILNADLAGSIAYSKLSLTGAILNADLAGSIAYSKLVLTGAVLNADLAGSIAASKLIGSDITTVGTIGTGTWNATAIADGKIASALTGKTYNGLTITATAGTLTIPNNASAALVLSGNFSTTLTATATTSLTLPTSGTLVSSVTTANGVSASNTAGALSFTLGAITPTTVNGNTFTTGSSTYTGTAGQTYTFPTTSATIARTDASNTFTGHQTIEGVTSTGATGTGKFVYDTNPTITGLIVGAGTATISPLTFTPGSAVVETASEQGDMEVDANGILYYSSAAAERGAIGSWQIIVLTSANTLTSQTGVQPIFDGGGGPTNGRLTVAGARSYFFQADLDVTNLSATSGTFSFAIGGTATLTSIRYSSMARKGTITTLGTPENAAFTTAASTILCSANGAAQGWLHLEGIIRINVAGTLIPQIAFSTVAGPVTPVIGINSWMKLTCIGTNTVVTVGNWD